MPRKRHPSVFTTSISGIPEELWSFYKNQVIRYRTLYDPKYTMRKAVEEAIDVFWSSFCHQEQDLVWVFPSHGKSIPIQVDVETRNIFNNFSLKTGYKKNVLFMSSICWHMRILIVAMADESEGSAAAEKNGVKQKSAPGSSNENKNRDLETLNRLIGNKTGRVFMLAENPKGGNPFQQIA